MEQLIQPAEKVTNLNSGNYNAQNWQDEIAVELMKLGKRLLGFI